jgi:putative oxidoreductase
MAGILPAAAGAGHSRPHKHGAVASGTSAAHTRGCAGAPTTIEWRPIMLRKLIATSPELVPMLARLCLGVVMFPHGAQKALGMFGGYGFSGTMTYFTDTMGIPWVFGFLAIVAEFLGSIGLIVGCLSRVAAFGIGCVMVVAVTSTHWKNGFFMNWSGKQAGEGYEYHMLAIALALIVVLRGGGMLSLDRRLAARAANN